MAAPRAVSSSDIDALSSVHSMVEAFKAFDSNGDGLITAEELKAIMASLGYGTGDLDGDGDGLLTVDEFLAVAAEGLDVGAIAGLLQAALPVLAGEGDDVVTGEVLHEVLSCMGRISLEDCIDIIASMDGDGDGAVSLEDLRSVIYALS
ncbi:putative calcium-binding protein CML29 [Apostasia shenzhenica]|uniref:Putative calcium-binding protein CML29 n=1 Tax=Apostasia shenzhenica TaxID=1088818 RepID=A0A2I0AEI3_9ASPA|nr:putative calcium-binding protein CML29 [Apostasia shenzhenica]